MTVEEQEPKPRNRIYVPSKTKAGFPIPDNIRQDFRDFIVKKFWQHKTGSTVIPNAIGTYSSDTGTAIVIDYKGKHEKIRLLCVNTPESVYP